MNITIKGAALLTLLFSLHMLVAQHSVEVGMIAPDFTLLDQNGKMCSVSAMKGHKLVLYFYPKDKSKHCTSQACSIRDSFSDLISHDITVWGINYDSPQSHKAFIEKYHLPFSLLTDANKKVSVAYGVKGFFVPARWAFLIDEQGTIVAIIKDVVYDQFARQIVAEFLETENK